jgi:AcrR family transcriptional regulator
MTRERTDLRVRRTHALLRKTLIDLIAEKGFDAVTVGDIAERAMVNRSTFYRHYPDKYALVTGIFEEAVDQVISDLGQEHLEALDWMVNALGTQAEQPVSPEMQHTLAAWVAFFEHFAKHAKLYQTMLGKHGSSWFTAQMRSYAASVLHQRLLASPWLRARQTESPNTMPEEVAIMSLANWFVGMLTWWLESGMAYTPSQMAIWSLRCITQGYVTALGINVSPMHESSLT